MRLNLNPFKKEKSIVVFHLIASSVTVFAIAGAIVCYHVFNALILSNVLFALSGFLLLTILTSSLFYLLPFVIVIKNQFFHILVKYAIAILILIIVTITTKNVSPPEEYEINDAIAVLTSLVPMVFTIVVVTLSRQNDYVLGLDCHVFRKNRRDIHFSLLEMIFVGIALFVIGYTFEMIEFYVPMWVTQGISVLYCIYFLVQEIPIITKNKTYLSFLARGMIRYSATFKEGSDIDKKEITEIAKIVSNKLSEEGLFDLYEEIKER